MANCIQKSNKNYYEKRIDKMEKYKLSKNKTLIIKDNCASIEINNILYTKHKFSPGKDIEIKAVKVIDSETVVLKVTGKTIHLKISGTAITIY